jgi:hypothetical protein
MKWFWCGTGETEEEFATRLANNLENLILKEGPETVKSLLPKLILCDRSQVYYLTNLFFSLSDCCVHC